MSEVAERLRSLGGETCLHLGNYHTHYEAAIGRLVETRALQRIWARDATWWSHDPPVCRDIEERLGWLDLPTTMRDKLAWMYAIARDAHEAGLDRAVLLGMGGSSLAAEVMRDTLCSANPRADLIVLDSTDPDQVAAVARSLDLPRTLFVVASKSGTTIETVKLLDYFCAIAQHAVGARWPAHFAAVTDRGTRLDARATAQAFRVVCRSAPDFGGRFSALSLYGLLPAALLGADLDGLLAGAERMARACGPSVAPGEHPGAVLGAALGGLANAPDPRDKLTLLTSPRLAAMGPWIEQLVAESTGKDGKGIVPVEAEPLMPPERYSLDRLFCYLRLAGDDNRETDAHVASLVRMGHPAVTIGWADAEALGGEFYRWEFATALAGGLLGVNPFDQPNVESAKANAAAILSRSSGAGSCDCATPFRLGSLSLYTASNAATGFDEALAGLLSPDARGYVAIMAYLPRTREVSERLQALRIGTVEATGVAATVGYGPRFLHSTGQIHKGGPEGGVFLQITHEPREAVMIPGQPGGFGDLQRAQADGDIAALRANGRRVARIHICGDVLPALDLLSRAVQRASISMRSR